MKKCPGCKDGKINCTSTDMTTGKISNWVIDCVTCEGTGKLDETDFSLAVENMAVEALRWCKCSEFSGIISFGEDEHKHCTEEHFDCARCGKIVQIG